ncbi:MAG: chemotaxis protein CheW [Capsulimonadaceae bacterium]|nr:chemotaxis protein CheW [Capsulimonadaceae bacterium]
MTTSTLEPIEHGVQADTCQLLTFQLAGEEYGLDILTVQEIRGFVPATQLPNSPKHIRGVLNLRGNIVPLYDLREMFNLPQIEYDQFAAIVVVTIEGRVIGLVVDRVSEVMTASNGDMQPSPNVGAAAEQGCIRGILRHEERLVILLDAVVLLTKDEHDYALAA